jgi:hypothetical protein
MCGQTCCLQLVDVNGYLKRWSNTADIDHVYHQARGFIDRDFDFGFFGVTKSSDGILYGSLYYAKRLLDTCINSTKT